MFIHSIILYEPHNSIKMQAMARNVKVLPNTKIKLNFLTMYIECHSDYKHVLRFMRLISNLLALYNMETE
jgi:hypothetical protein